MTRFLFCIRVADAGGALTTNAFFVLVLQEALQATALIYFVIISIVTSVFYYTHMRALINRHALHGSAINSFLVPSVTNQIEEKHQIFYEKSECRRKINC